MNRNYLEKEIAREKAFESIWASDLDAAFSDVARYYDRANNFASLGLVNRLSRRFLSTIAVKPNDRVLDVCAGANAVGIGLMQKEPQLEVYAVDRSAAMQEFGKNRAEQYGFHIKSMLCDVHTLPFPDDYFDVVTLQWATRHLRVVEVFSEIKRVLKPGGCFYHCDMLRPPNKVVENVYCYYLDTSISLASLAFNSASAVKKVQDYFIDAIRMFYSAEELSELLAELGFSRVVGNSVMGGMMGFHAACKSH